MLPVVKIEVARDAVDDTAYSSGPYKVCSPANSGTLHLVCKFNSIEECDQALRDHGIDVAAKMRRFIAETDEFSERQGSEAQPRLQHQIGWVSCDRIAIDVSCLPLRDIVKRGLEVELVLDFDEDHPLKQPARTEY